MLHLVRMSKAQLAADQGSWRIFDYQFGGPSGLFLFKGQLDVSAAGEVSLKTFLAAHSCEHALEEHGAAISEMRGEIVGGNWDVVQDERDHLLGSRPPFEIELLSQTTRDGIGTHLLLSFGNPEAQREEYFESDFALRSEASNPEVERESPDGYYPVAGGRSPEKAEELGTGELAHRLRGQSLIAFTGAGISLDSGIPAFSGVGGLQEAFPIRSYRFPGEVASWLLRTPEKSARILAGFHSKFLIALPNAAHVALADLEKAGILSHIVTGNMDGLHEKAGSKSVHINEAEYFKKSNVGWHWIRDADAAVVAGVSMDANNGLLDFARDQGVQLTVIDPERPAFLHEEDWYVRGRAQTVLMDLVKVMTA